MARRRSNRSNQGNSGWFLNLVIIGMLGFLLFGMMGGALGGEGASQRQGTIYPSIPVQSSTLGIQPSVVVMPEPTPTVIVYQPVVVYQEPQSAPVVVPFVVQPPACTVPEGWRVGVSPLPDCWELLSREEQNQIIRSH